MNLKPLFTLVLALTAIAGAQRAYAMDSAACLSQHKPLIRNTDGSLSPNPDFDACLLAPASKAKAPTPVKASVSPASGIPSNPTAAPVVVPGPTPAPSNPVTVAPLPKPTPPPPPKPIWKATPGQTVQSALAEWTKDAEWTLVWQATDLHVDLPFRFQGDFLQAVEQFLKVYRNAEQPPKGCAFTKPSIPVLLVTRNPTCPSDRK